MRKRSPPQLFNMDGGSKVGHHAIFLVCGWLNWPLWMVHCIFRGFSVFRADSWVDLQLALSVVCRTSGPTTRKKPRILWTSVFKNVPFIFPMTLEYHVIPASTPTDFQRAATLRDVAEPMAPLGEFLWDVRHFTSPNIPTISQFRRNPPA
jgi:hypothetical protein